METPRSKTLTSEAGAKRRKILVTGGAGYIGSTLVPRLLDAGYDVRVFDKLIYGDQGLDSVKGQFEMVQGDMLDLPGDLLQGIDGIIHLAGFSTEPTAHFSPRLTDLVTHIGTENLAKMAKANGVKHFVYASTCSVYFTYDTPIVPPLFKEDDKVNTISPYAITKRSAEQALLEMVDETFQPVMFRMGTIYGFSPKMRYDLVVNSMTKDAFLNGKVNVHARGNIFRPLLDVQYAASAYIKALEMPHDETGGEIFNIVNSNWQLLEFAEELKKWVAENKKKNIDIDVHQTGVARNYLADDAKFLRVFKLPPPRDMYAAIGEIWNNLENGHDAADPRFYTDSWMKKQMGI